MWFSAIKKSLTGKYATEKKQKHPVHVLQVKKF